MRESETIDGFTSGNATHGDAIFSDQPNQDHDEMENSFNRETDQHPHHHDDHEFSKEEQKQ